MGIRWAEDLGIPAGVALGHYGTEKFDEGRIEGVKAEPIVGIVLTAAGYVMCALGIGGNYSKNLGIASLDWGVKGFRTLLAERGILRRTSASSRLTMTRRVGATTPPTAPPGDTEWSSASVS